MRISRVRRHDMLCEDCGLAVDSLVPSSLASFGIADSVGLVTVHGLAAVLH